jgi:hypothetical protein
MRLFRTRRAKNITAVLVTLALLPVGLVIAGAVRLGRMIFGS